MALSNKITLEVIHQYGTEEHRGLVAQARFEPGELVWWLDSYSDEPGVVMTRAQIDATFQPQRDILTRYSYMRSDDQYETTLDPESDPSWFFNHSCDPNCGYDGDERIVRVLFRRHHRQLEIRSPRDAVVIEGKQRDRAGRARKLSQ